ncbi:carotenoid ester lipase precursor [Exidia glandulosa HHB12029]|uniref:Carboxylic ester hydrolase n=1 Tax=Exidia glandulosa HHB12029 TaxID=1314781 RepID=A0A165J2R4_EXIGL|nr:carotenoid ester lipase precursor [Exidia glandulosa HHB12029]
MRFSTTFFLLVCSGGVIALTSDLRIPQIHLSHASVVGKTVSNTEQFLGIPFALPPTGRRRFVPPVPYDVYTGVINATAYGLACPQLGGPPGNPGPPPAESEDCLTMNIIRPAGLKSYTRLPVAVWFHGGGFLFGRTESNDGTPIVIRSMELNMPVIYASMQYRLNAFGFLPGKEVEAAGVGNLGLRDQRMALKWIQQHIASFGGDPYKVTIWGESAGAMSVAVEMITNGGHTDGLFRAAFMQSGSPQGAGDIELGQPYYDFLLRKTGCEDAEYTLECLRDAPFESLKAAVNQTAGLFSRHNLALAWKPRVDGEFLVDDPPQLPLRGSVGRVPFVTGDVDDEGTLFVQPLGDLNMTADLKNYLQTFYLASAHEKEVDEILSLYPDDVTQGPPFNTCTANVAYPQYKRVAAIAGDIAFQAPRRLLLDSTFGKQDSWAFLSKRNKTTPIVGSFHTTDIGIIYAPSDLTDYLIRHLWKIPLLGSFRSKQSTRSSRSKSSSGACQSSSGTS